jgi:hypothetical protein
MGTPIDQIAVEIDPGDLQTRYVELGEMAIRHAQVPPMTDMGPRPCQQVLGQPA